MASKTDFELVQDAIIAISIMTLAPSGFVNRIRIGKNGKISVQDTVPEPEKVDLQQLGDLKMAKWWTTKEGKASLTVYALSDGSLLILFSGSIPILNL